MSNKLFDLRDEVPYWLYLPFITIANFILYWFTVFAIYVIGAEITKYFCTPLRGSSKFCFGFGGYDTSITFEDVFWYGGWVLLAITIYKIYQRYLWSKLLEADSKRLSLKIIFISTTVLLLILLDLIGFFLRGVVL